MRLKCSLVSSIGRSTPDDKQKVAGSKGATRQPCQLTSYCKWTKFCVFFRLATKLNLKNKGHQNLGYKPEKIAKYRTMIQDIRRGNKTYKKGDLVLF